METEQTARRYNVKAIFDVQGHLHDLIFGDFGLAIKPDAGKPAREKPLDEDCLISWPCDPESTGKRNIALMLKVPMSRGFLSQL